MLLYARRYIYTCISLISCIELVNDFFPEWREVVASLFIISIRLRSASARLLAADCITTRQCFNKKVPWRNTSLWRWRKKIKEPEGLEKKKIPNRAKGWRRPPACHMPIEPTVSKACPKNYRRRFVRSTFLFSSRLKTEWATLWSHSQLGITSYAQPWHNVRVLLWHVLQRAGKTPHRVRGTALSGTTQRGSRTESRIAWFYLS